MVNEDRPYHNCKKIASSEGSSIGSSHNNATPLTFSETKTAEETIICDVFLSVPEELTSTSNHRSLSRWELPQNIKCGFWKKWSSDFLSSLQPRKKWQDAQPNLKEDDIVLLKEEVPPGAWPMA
ncbi:hypothetical protein TNIN_85971 [Trichonephila inaurata madagascariensis]|uniref:DUF5641 domain-containing protein n=1 Tax=Trichonephila inaurata madagascariensis TaxID=2747483 RepID=A0A8X6XHE1_9ARAC|nr:hypothetical protein TNIN_85971 [Trichonephila inaurata madagascariensis]